MSALKTIMDPGDITTMLGGKVAVQPGQSNLKVEMVPGTDRAKATIAFEFTPIEKYEDSGTHKIVGTDSYVVLNRSTTAISEVNLRFIAEELPGSDFKLFIELGAVIEADKGKHAK